MEILFKTSYRLNLAYAYLLAVHHMPPIKNEISEKINSFNQKIQFRFPDKKIDFHHSKLGRRLLISKSDNDFAKISDLNDQDKFDAGKCEFIIPDLIKYAENSKFKEFYLKEIQPLEIEKMKEKQHLVLEGLNITMNYWDCKAPESITILNNALRGGGHLDIITKKEETLLTIDFFNHFDNMIRYLAIHEFSHYFQNKLFSKIKDEINKKSNLFSHKDESYSDWESWFSENLIEAVIFSLIRPPPKEIRLEHLQSLKDKYDLIENIVNIIEEEKFKIIGKDEIIFILKNLN